MVQNSAISIHSLMLAQTLHELNPARSVEQWRAHIESSNTPEKFFNGNAEGLQQYLAFVSHFDADKRKRAQRLRAQRG